MQRIILLYWNDINVGGLSYYNDNYVFNKNKQNIKYAQEEGCPLIFDNCINYKEIPPVFYDLEVDNNRKDLIEKLGIKETDNRFDRLCKVAENHKLYSKDGFWIKLYEKEEK